MEGLSQLLSLLQVALGIGLVIFVHELGHFIAARLCGVRVVTFSLGFGPRLLGWRRGDTQYQLAAIPLGGFCRMAGEERRQDGLPPRDDELPSKGVGQRFFIYSGGVVMNVLFALALFPVLFRVGVPFLRPVIGEPVPGSPAWEAGLVAGTEVVAVDGADVYDFTHIATEVALGPSGPVQLTVREPGAEDLRTVFVQPRMSEERGLRTIGVMPALERDEAGRALLHVLEDSPAAEAGLRSGDRVDTVIGARPGFDLLREITERMTRGEPLELVVLGEDDEPREVRVLPRPSDQVSRPRVGILSPVNHVVGLRKDELVRTLGLRKGDRILRAQGRPVRRFGDFTAALLEAPGPLELSVRRGQRVLTLQGPEVDAATAAALAGDVALAQDLDSTQIVVSPGEPAALAGLRDGDRILEIDGTETHTWADVTQLIGLAGREGRGVTVSIERGEDDLGEGAPAYVEISVAPAPAPLHEYGLTVRRAEYVFRTDGLLEAFQVGALCSWRFLKDSWLTLLGILGGDVSSDNIGGIITISVISYSLAQTGLAKLLFFLGMLSINLAFINVLPIPVLDGGHLFFLIVEKIKGSPVSERVLGYSQMVGVVLILSLIVFVTYNDLVRVLG